MDRYATNSKGLAPALSDIINEYSKMPRSAFDKSSRKSLDVSPFYIIPFDIIKLLPNTDVNLSYDIQVINKNPTIRRMLGSMSLETRTYIVKDSDCWEGHNNFVTCGRSGKVSKQIPRLKWRLGSGKTTCLPYNPYFLLNIAPARYLAASTELEPSRLWSFEANSGLQDVSTLQDSGLTLIPSNYGSEDNSVLHDVSALPGVFYTKIAKEYQNSNLLQDNPFWYPENENHDLILPYSLPNNADSVTNACYDYPTEAFGAGSGTDYEKNSIFPTNDLHSMPWLNVLYRCQRKGNYFNTGSPFPNLLRGDMPTLEILSGRVNVDDLFADDSLTENKIGMTIGMFETHESTPSRVLNLGIIKPTEVSGLAGELVSNGNSIALKQLLSKATVSGIEISISQWRRLATMWAFREKMARTDGSYNLMVKAQFGINPHWHEHGVNYVGGSFQPIVFSEVTQTSADSNTPLGTTGGRFVSAAQNNRISFHSDDFGMMMSVLTIIPDDYYCQGIDRVWSALDNADIPFPIFNNLDPQAILNKELIVTGDNTEDNDVLAYAERYSEYKSGRNEISGLLAMPVSKVGDIGTFFFNRLLTAAPQFNWSFVEGKMTSNENLVFASTEQAQFVVTIARNKHVVYPMPTISRPSDMGISYA